MICRHSSFQIQWEMCEEKFYTLTLGIENTPLIVGIEKVFLLSGPRISVEGQRARDPCRHDLDSFQSFCAVCQPPWRLGRGQLPL